MPSAAPTAPERAALARDLLVTLAERTGLTSKRPAERYLWTDAFAVCTFLAFDESELAVRLVDQVHDVLGRHRPDDSRRGWLSRLSDEEAKQHPTRGGLRIGKPLPERAAGTPLDEGLEWDRDGQYFHYLTQWIHALNQVAIRTGAAEYNLWARELAATAHAAFTSQTAWGGRRMHWKMSIDLAHPLVASMGAHDPLDGLITCLDLSLTAAQRGWKQGPDLAPAAADFASMLPMSLATSDPLGIGGLLRDVHRAERLRRAGMLSDSLRGRLVEEATVSLAAFVGGGELRRPTATRLAFRELGLAVGLAAVPGLRASVPNDRALETLARYEPLRHEIEADWSRPASRATRLWLEHRNINDVMLAAALVPDGYLGAMPADA